MTSVGGQLCSRRCFRNSVVLTDVLLLFPEHQFDPVTHLTIRDLDVVLGVTVVVHEREEAVVGDVELCNVSFVAFLRLNDRNLQAGTRGG